MSESKNVMVTRNSTQLKTCTLPVAVIKITFSSLLPFTPVNSYLSRCSQKHLVFAFSFFTEFSKSHSILAQFAQLVKFAKLTELARLAQFDEKNQVRNVATICCVVK